MDSSIFESTTTGPRGTFQIIGHTNWESVSWILAISGGIYDFSFCLGSTTVWGDVTKSSNFGSENVGCPIPSPGFFHHKIPKHPFKIMDPFEVRVQHIFTETAYFPGESSLSLNKFHLDKFEGTPYFHMHPNGDSWLEQNANDWLPRQSTELFSMPWDPGVRH